MNKFTPTKNAHELREFLNSIPTKELRKPNPSIRQAIKEYCKLMKDYSSGSH